MTKWQGREESLRQARTLNVQAETASERLDFERDIFESQEAEREATGDFFQEIYRGGETTSRSAYDSSPEQEADAAWQNYYTTVMETEY